MPDRPETCFLTPPQDKFDNRVSYPGHGTRRRLRQRYGLRQRLLIIAAIFVAGFLIAKFFAHVTTDTTEPPGDTGSAAPSSISPPSARSGISPEPAAPEMASPRVTALRAALDAQGYTSVQFRIEGDTVDLWGTVPSEFDRMAVQAIVFTTTRIISLQDHIRVQDEYGGP